MRAVGLYILALGGMLAGMSGAVSPLEGMSLIGPPVPASREAKGGPFPEESRGWALGFEGGKVLVEGSLPSDRAEEAEGPPPATASGIPERLVIPSIALDAPVLPAESRIVAIGGRRYREWLAPDRYAAGWHPTSARVGTPGNTVLSGHNNIAGAVFRRLADVRIGDRIRVYTRDGVFLYEVTERHILPERGQPLAIRLANARWIGPTADERLTLVTCWPPWGNSHRLIVVARPLKP